MHGETIKGCRLVSDHRFESIITFCHNILRFLIYFTNVPVLLLYIAHAVTWGCTACIDLYRTLKFMCAFYSVKLGFRPF